MVGGYARQFTQELQALYAAAGSPPYPQIVAYGARQVRPVAFRDATLSDWLTKGSVPGSRSVRAFEVLITLLEQLASQRPGHVRRSSAEWEQLRIVALAERNAARAQPARSALDQAPPDLAREAAVPGVPIEQCDPLDLEVHAAGEGPGRDAVSRLPGYVRRAHDEVLTGLVAQAAAGNSVMAVLIGSSSTGKTRACWEALRQLARLEPGWRVWHPFDPTRAQAALSGIEAVEPRTVVWLNETQHYLNTGEPMAAALHALLTDPARSPVLVLGTLWPEHDRRYASQSGPDDPYGRARALLDGRRIAVPETFDEAALAEARALAESGDRLLAGVLAREHEGRVAQHLAGAPELLARQHGASPGERGLLEAAEDARRLGVGLHLPLGFLAGAAPGYLDRDAYDALGEDWLERALAELARPVHGNLAPLRRVREDPDYSAPGTRPPPTAPLDPVGPLYRLADYLDQHGSRTRRLLCPPASFWHAAYTHLTSPDDLHNLAIAARTRGRLQWADAFYQRAAEGGDRLVLLGFTHIREQVGGLEAAVAVHLRAAEAGDTFALAQLAAMREKAKEWEAAEALYLRAAEAGLASALTSVAVMWEKAKDRERAKAMALRAAEAGDTSALTRLAEMREGYDKKGAEALLHRAVEAGDASALLRIAKMRALAYDLKGAEALYLRAAEAGHAPAVTQLALVRERAGDLEAAEALYLHAAEAGDTSALTRLAEMLYWAKDREGAETVALRAAEAGDTSALTQLAVLRENAEDRQGAEALALRAAAKSAKTSALTRLAVIRDEAGDRQGAAALALRAATFGNTSALTRLAAMREEAEDQQGAEILYRRAVEAGDTRALTRLAILREEAGDRQGAEDFALRAAEAGHGDGLTYLAGMRLDAGSQDDAKRLLHRAADAGVGAALAELALLLRYAGDRDGANTLYRYGLEPNGEPSAPWTWS